MTDFISWRFYKKCFNCQKIYMRKTLLLIILCLGASQLFAQSEAETLEWLNVKKIDILSPKSNNIEYGGSVEFTKDLIKITDAKGIYFNMTWNDIKEVKMSGNYEIEIVFGYVYSGKPGYIRLSVYNAELKLKMQKALKHMATLKGAKMIDSDLF
jgi:hypothetical protein